MEARGVHGVRPLTPDELAEVEAAQRRWGGDAATLSNVAHLASDRCRVVVAGQQVGLAAGPLLVVHKALGAILLARRLQAAHPELAFVPVFWAAGEDHDFEEVREVVWPARAGGIGRWAVPEAATVPGRMSGAIVIGPWIDELIRALEADTLPTQWRGEVLDLLREAYGGAATMEDGFCRLILRMFAGSGLVVVTPRMRWLRRRAQPIFARELELARAGADLVGERTGALELAGLETGLRRPRGALNFFLVDESDRRWVLRIGGDGQLRRQSAAGAGGDWEPVDMAELEAAIEQTPERLSTNVVTRPLLQDTALPTVAQVVGPGEATYLAQVEAVYEAHGAPAPVRWPRPRVLLVEPRVARQLDKHGLTLEEARAADVGDLIERVMRREGESGKLGRVERLAAVQRGELAALRGELGSDPALVGAIDKLMEMLDRGYGRLTERLIASEQRGREDLARAMATVAASLRPAGRPQERVLNPLVPFAVNHGPDWPMRAAAVLSVDPAAGEQIVHLGDL